MTFGIKSRIYSVKMPSEHNLDHHLTNMTKGFFRTEIVVFETLVSKTFHSNEGELLCFHFIFQEVQKIFWPEHRCQNETAS